MKLYLVRHGETDWNTERKLQGQVDIPLNEFGRTLAVKTGKGLENIQFDICFTSPLKRAKETAELILTGRDVPIVDEMRIVEMSFAEWEGKHCSKERWEVPDSFQKFFDDPANFEPAPEGESFAQVKKRTDEFLQWLYNKKEFEDCNVLITTHGAALAGLINNIKGESLEKYWGVGVHKNCAVTEVEVKDQIPTILTENKVYYDDKVKEW